MDSAKRLAQLAETLDKRGLTKLADSVDRVLSSVVKTSQYVGVQGYWVRNQRCWANCYRQKRAAAPSKEAQTIWFECQSEYQNSLGSEDATWDKYAADNGKFVKTAAHQQQEQYFATKLSEAEDPSYAFDIINGVYQQSIENYVDASSNLLRIAEVLEDSDLLLANEAGAISGALLKEAQATQNLKGIWNQLKNKFKGTFDPNNFNHGSMNGMIKDLGNTFNGYKVLREKIISTLQKVNSPEAKQYADQMMPLVKGVLSPKSIQQLSDLALKWDQSAGKPAAPGNPNDPSKVRDSLKQYGPGNKPTAPAPTAGPVVTSPQPEWSTHEDVMPPAGGVGSAQSTPNNNLDLTLPFSPPKPAKPKAPRPRPMRAPRKPAPQPELAGATASRKVPVVFKNSNRP